MRCILAFLFLTMMIPTFLSPLMFSSRVYTCSLTVYAPAVSRGGGGALLEINLTIKYPGSGRVYFSAKPLVELDTQATARIASYVAASITGHNYYSYDYIVETTSTSLVVGGPSAGALMTIGFIALFLNKTLNPKITMTGMINPDGSIGPVGGLLDKLEAVASNGYKIFLIPQGQRTIYVAERIVKRYPWGYYETIKYRQVDLVKEGEKRGVIVIEVNNILQAMKYFLNLTFKTPNIKLNITSSLLNKLNNTLNHNLEEINKLYNESKQIYNKLDFYTKLQLYNIIDKVDKMNNELQETIRNKHIAYAIQYSYHVLRENLRLNWILKYMVNKLDLPSIEETINKTIDQVKGELENRNTLNPYFIEASKEYYVAVNNYIYVLEKHREISVSEQIDRLSEILVKLYRAEYYLELSINDSSKNISLEETIRTLYSIADSFTSYAYSLARDIGSTNNYLEKAFNNFDLAIKAYSESDTFASIGLFIDTITYTNVGIETLFIDNDEVLKNISLYLRNETLYYMSIYGVDEYATHMITCGDQALTSNKPLETIYYYLKAIMYRLTLSNKTVNIEYDEVTPIINTNTNNIGSSSNRELNPYIGTIDYLLGVLTGVLLFTLIYMITRGKGSSKKVVEY